MDSRKREKTIEEILTMILWVLIGFFLLVFLIVWNIPTLRDYVTAPCVLRTVFGFYCPGCGGTRAVKALLQGKILTSLYYHPLVLYGAVGVGAFLITNSLAMITKGKIKGLPYKSWYLYGIIAVIVVNFLWKNIALLNGIELIP